MMNFKINNHPKLFKLTNLTVIKKVDKIVNLTLKQHLEETLKATNQAISQEFTQAEAPLSVSSKPSLSSPKASQSCTNCFRHPRKT